MRKKNPLREPPTESEIPEISVTATSLRFGEEPDPPRFGEALIQEQSSKSALMKWLQSKQWLPNEPKVDLGEDFLVNIYEDKRSTGLSFFLQHKSADDIDKFKLKETPCLSYPIEVKDLLHWKKLAVPVYLVICDVKNENERYWIGIREVVQSLAKQDPKWFNQTSVQVRIPLDNTLDDDGMAMMRIEIANWFHPIYQRQFGKPMFQFSLAFPPTEEGKKAHQKVNRAFDMGTPITIDRKYLTDLQWPDWIRRTYGSKIEPSSIRFQPHAPKKEANLRLEVLPQDDSPPVSYPLRLKTIRAGRKEMLFSNRDSNCPLIFTMKATMEEQKTFINMNFRMRHAGNTVSETIEALRFLIATGKEGEVCLIAEDSGSTITSNFTLATQGQIEQLSFQLSLAEKLLLIQRKLRLAKSFSLKNKKLGPRDYRDIETLYAICKTGQQEHNATFTVTIGIDEQLKELMKKERTENPCLEISIRAKIPYKILGVTVELGTGEGLTKLTPEQTLAFIQQINESISQGKSAAKITLPNVYTRFVYTDLTRPRITEGVSNHAEISQ